MNKDKAIQLLERLQDPEPYEPMLTKDAYDAIQMAIDALSADGDTISREAAIDALDDAEDAFGYLTRDWEEMLNELPPAQLGTNLAEVGTDCISRQAAIDGKICIRRSNGVEIYDDYVVPVEYLEQLQPAQPEPSQVAADIARIVENGQDMMVIQPEIIYCKDCKKQNRHYHESPYKDTVCPLTAWRGTAQGHEYDYQFCCFAERREVTT